MGYKPKKILFWLNLRILAVLGTCWTFFFFSFFDQTAPQKTKKNDFFGQIYLFWQFWALFGTFFFFFYQTAPPKNKKNDFFGQIYPFRQFWALLDLFFFFFFSKPPPKKKKKKKKKKS